MINKSDCLNKIYKAGFNYESNYGFCSQAVLLALSDYFDFISEEVIKASQTLAGGGALIGDGTCGALSGGYLAIGNAFGREKKDLGKINRDNLMKSCVLSKTLQKKFINEYDSVICNKVQKEIMGKSFDLWNPKQYKMFEEAGGHTDKCTNVTGNVAKWVAEILIENSIEVKKSKQ